MIELNNSKIKYIKNEKNLGMFENWNKCIKESAGQYVTLLNDDDELAQNFLQTAKNYLDGKKLIIFSFFTIGNKNKKKNFRAKKCGHITECRRLFLWGWGVIFRGR